MRKINILNFFIFLLFFHIGILLGNFLAQKMPLQLQMTYFETNFIKYISHADNIDNTVTGANIFNLKQKGEFDYNINQDKDSITIPCYTVMQIKNTIQRIPQYEIPKSEYDEEEFQTIPISLYFIILAVAIPIFIFFAILLIPSKKISNSLLALNLDKKQKPRKRKLGIQKRDSYFPDEDNL